MPSASGGPEAGKHRHIADEDLDHLGVPLASGTREKGGDRLLDALRRPIWTVVDEGVECVAYGDDPREPRDVGAGEPVRVPGAVEMLVVVADDREQAGAGPEGS